MTRGDETHEAEKLLHEQKKAIGKFDSSGSDLIVRRGICWGEEEGRKFSGNEKDTRVWPFDTFQLRNPYKWTHEPGVALTDSQNHDQHKN